MAIKPDCSTVPACNSGCHKPSEAPPRRTIEKRHDTQFNDTFTELRDSISSMRVVMAKEGEESAMKDPQEVTPKLIGDEVSQHPTRDIIILTYNRRPLYVWRESILRSSRRETAEVKEEPKEELTEQNKPSIPERPARKASEDRPAIPERPKPKHTTSDEGKSKPPVSDKPKPQIPPRPTKASSGDSTEPKQKPPVPSRPAGSKIAALQAGFMSDLNKRLKLGPQAPKKEDPKPQEDLTEEREKAPLSDARKGRARGPQRRAPAKSPAAAPSPAVQSAGPSLSFSTPQTLWSIDPEGSLSVSGERTPVSEPEPAVEKTEEPVAEPVTTQEPLPKSEPNLEPKPELRSEPESESVPVHRDPEPAAGKLPQEAEPELPAQQPAVEPSPEPAPEASLQEPEPEREQEPIQVEKSLVTNTAGESILETTVDKTEGGDAVEPVAVSDEVKQ